MVEGTRFKQLDALLEVNALAEVLYPPLSALPGWKLRSEKLARVGIMTIADFLEADDERLRRLFGRRTLRSINDWKRELQDWLVVDEPEKKK